MDVVSTELLIASAPPGSASASPPTSGSSQPFDATLLLVMAEAGAASQPPATTQHPTQDNTSAQNTGEGVGNPCEKNDSISSNLPDATVVTADAVDTPTFPASQAPAPFQPRLNENTFFGWHWSHVEQARDDRSVQPASSQVTDKWILPEQVPTDQDLPGQTRLKQVPTEGVPTEAETDGSGTEAMMTCLMAVNAPETLPRELSEESTATSVPANPIDLGGTSDHDFPSEATGNTRAYESRTFASASPWAADKPTSGELTAKGNRDSHPSTASDVSEDAGTLSPLIPHLNGSPAQQPKPSKPSVDVPQIALPARDLPRWLLLRTEQGGRHTITVPTGNASIPVAPQEPPPVATIQPQATDPVANGVISTVVSPIRLASTSEVQRKAEPSAKPATPSAQEGISNSGPDISAPADTGPFPAWSVPSWVPPSQDPVAGATDSATKPLPATATARQDQAAFASIDDAKGIHVTSDTPKGPWKPNATERSSSQESIPLGSGLSPNSPGARSSVTSPHSVPEEPIPNHTRVGGDSTLLTSDVAQSESVPVTEVSSARTSNFGLDTWSVLSSISLVASGIRRGALAPGTNSPRRELQGLDAINLSTSVTEMSGPTAAKEAISARGPAFATAEPFRQVADLVSTSLTLRQDNERPTLEATLSPPDLGRIRIEIHAQGEQLSARILVAEHSTLNLLQSTLPELRDQLQQMGVHTDSLALTAWNEHRADANTDSRQQGVDYSSDDVARPMLKTRQITSVPQGRGSSRLDVRL